MFVSREEFTGSMMVDNGEAIVTHSRGSFRQINANSGLYIGNLLSQVITIEFLFGRRRMQKVLGRKQFL